MPSRSGEDDVHSSDTAKRETPARTRRALTMSERGASHTTNCGHAVPTVTATTDTALGTPPRARIALTRSSSSPTRTASSVPAGGHSGDGHSGGAGALQNARNPPDLLYQGHELLRTLSDPFLSVLDSFSGLTHAPEPRDSLASAAPAGGHGGGGSGGSERQDAAQDVLVDAPELGEEDLLAFAGLLTGRGRTGPVGAGAAEGRAVSVKTATTGGSGQASRTASWASTCSESSGAACGSACGSWATASGPEAVGAVDPRCSPRRTAQRGYGSGERGHWHLSHGTLPSAPPPGVPKLGLSRMTAVGRHVEACAALASHGAGRDRSGGGASSSRDEMGDMLEAGAGHQQALPHAEAGTSGDDELRPAAGLPGSDGHLRGAWDGATVAAPAPQHAQADAGANTAARAAAQRGGGGALPSRAVMDLFHQLGPPWTPPRAWQGAKGGRPCVAAVLDPSSSARRPREMMGLSERAPGVPTPGDRACVSGVDGASPAAAAGGAVPWLPAHASERAGGGGSLGAAAGDASHGTSHVPPSLPSASSSVGALRICAADTDTDTDTRPSPSPACGDDGAGVQGGRVDEGGRVTNKLRSAKKLGVFLDAATLELEGLLIKVCLSLLYLRSLVGIGVPLICFILELRDC